jgi:hypothetical protein
MVALEIKIKAFGSIWKFLELCKNMGNQRIKKTSITKISKNSCRKYIANCGNRENPIYIAKHPCAH